MHRVRQLNSDFVHAILKHLGTVGFSGAPGSDGRPKSWWIEVGEEALDDELRFLRAEIYRYPDADPPIKRFTAFDLFRA